MSSTTEDKGCLLSIRLHDGTAVKAKFKSNMTLNTVYKYVVKKAEEMGMDKKVGGNMYHRENGFEFQTLLPPKQTFSPETFATTTLEKAGLTPSGSIVVIKTNGAKDLEKGEGTIHDAKKKIDIDLAPHRLKGESREQKEQFKKQLNMEEAKMKKEDRMKKKTELEKIRLSIQSDREDRKDRQWIPDEYRPKEKEEDKSSKTESEQDTTVSDQSDNMSHEL